MKVAVIGSRGFTNYDLLKNELDKYTISMIISGGAIGADKLAEKYAKENNIKTQIIYPDWNTYGRGAGLIRNKDIVNESDIVIAFWDGTSKGTKFSIDYANKNNKKINMIKV